MGTGRSVGRMMDLRLLLLLLLLLKFQTKTYMLWLKSVNLQVAGGRIQDRGGGREEVEGVEGLQPTKYL